MKMKNIKSEIMIIKGSDIYEGSNSSEEDSQFTIYIL